MSSLIFRLRFGCVKRRQAACDAKSSRQGASSLFPCLMQVLSRQQERICGGAGDKKRRAMALPFTYEVSHAGTLEPATESLYLRSCAAQNRDMWVSTILSYSPLSLSFASAVLM